MGLVTFDAVREKQLRAVATAFLRLRPWIVAPALGLTLLVLARSGAPPRQLLAVGCGSVVMLSFFTFEAWLGRRRQVTEGWLFGSLLLTLTGVGLNCAFTGGVRSPTLPLLFAPLVIAFSAFGRALKSTLAGIYGSALVALLLILPPGVPFAPVPEAAARGMSFVTVLTAALLLWVGVSGLTDAFGSAGKELERLRAQALDALGARAQDLEILTQNLAHELKNPLASIKGLTQLLASAELDEKHERRRRVMLEEVERAERVLREHLSFSRPLQRLERAPTNLADLVHDVCSLLQARAELARVSFSLALAPQREQRPTADSATAPAHAAELVVLADRARLEEALVNLMANAIEASRAGGHVALSLHADTTATTLVIHNETSMSRQTLERVGRPFFTTKRQGTGLGVVLARNIIEQHGGSLAFESEAHVGTKVSVTLPRASEMSRSELGAAEALAETAHAASAAEPANFGGQT